jgi:hypothetical protein
VIDPDESAAIAPHPETTMSLRRLVTLLLSLALLVPALAPGAGRAMDARSAAKPAPAKPSGAERPVGRRTAAAMPGLRRLIGDWNGALGVGGQKIRIVFHFTLRADGKLAATMDSPDQGAMGLVMDEVVLRGDSLRLTLASVHGSYRGLLAADGLGIKGTWFQGGVSMPLDFGRGEPPELRRPQDPLKPYPYDVEEVVIDNPAADVKLAGTLTTPRGSGPFPAAVLISGSGPQNRDEELLGHRPFLVLADRLTRAGLAVLRCDDRGTALSTGSFATATTADFAADVRAEVEWLKTRARVDSARIGLVGHSEGGLVAPLLAADRKDIAFLVLAAGPGVPGDSLLMIQSKALLQSSHQQDSLTAWNSDLQRKLFALVKAEKDSISLRQDLRAMIAGAVQDLPASQSGLVNPRFAEQQAQMLSSPWFRWFVDYDPRPALQRVTCPVLALTGGCDLQVPAEVNLPAIAAALRAGGNRDFATVEMPGLNHLFQTSATGLPAEYGVIEETIAPAALDTITNWIVARVGKSRR